MKIDFEKYHHFDTKKIENAQNITFFYQGERHDTYKIRINDQFYQLRLNKKTNPINKEEIDFIKQNLAEDFIYIDQQGNFIRRWFEGQTLENVKLTPLIVDNLIQKVKQFQNYQISKEFEWYINIEDESYQQFLKRVKKKRSHFQITSHCDLRAKNILVNDQGKIWFLDFEWVRKSSKYHDPVLLSYYLGISKTKIVKEFKLCPNFFEEYKKAIILFDKKWYMNSKKE